MGWYTQTIHIIESVLSEQVAKDIVHNIFENEGKYSHHNNGYFCYFREDNNTWSVYYYYEVRKYTNFHSIQKLSKKYPDAYFTSISCPEIWTGDPASIMKFSKGDLNDGYGIAPFFADNSISIRYKIVEEPFLYCSLIYNWFKRCGKEEQIRSFYPVSVNLDLDKHDELDNILEIKDTDYLIANYLIKQQLSLEKLEWIKYDEFKALPDRDDYTYLITTSSKDKVKIDEKSLLAFVLYNPLLNSLEEDFIEYFGWEIIKLTYPFFNRYYVNELKKLGIEHYHDLENTIELYEEKIFGLYEQRRRTMGESTKLIQGFFIKALIHIKNQEIF